MNVATPQVTVPYDEAARLAAVRRYDVLDTPPDGAFDRVTRLAAHLFGMPISIVSIIDQDRIWFKSRYGIDVDQIDRDPGLCASAILTNEPWVVEEARTDPRTLANPLVASDFGLQFYAGAPLHTFDGHNLGTMCVIDRKPRQFSEADRRVLQDLAAIVVDELELRIAARQVEAEAQNSVRRREDRERQVMQLNDEVLQRLAVAKLSLEVGNGADVGQEIAGALELVKLVLAELAAEATTFRREVAAG